MTVALFRVRRKLASNDGDRKLLLTIVEQNNKIGFEQYLLEPNVRTKCLKIVFAITDGT